jgi:HPt (histidine-containing phosphotransfer) domain-containing protein
MGKAMAEPVFDFEAALKSVFGKNAILRRVLAKYLENTPLAVEEVRRALREGNPETAAVLGHRLKGSSATVHAMELRAIFRELETAARAGRLEDANARLEEVEESYQRFGARIKELDL